MATYRTPNVYVEEISVFPPSVAEVETAIPAFIGFTEKAMETAKDDLLKKPMRIRSMKEYEQYFGGPEPAEISVSADDAGDSFTVELTMPELKYLLHYCMQMYFANGGGPCYVVSVGGYSAPVTDTVLLEGLAAIRSEDEPTLLVVPDAVNLTPAAKYSTVVQAMLTQCGELGDRFSIFDIRRGTQLLNSGEWNGSRERFGNDYLKYGAAYYPFLTSALNYHVTSDQDGVPGENVNITHPASDATATEVKLTSLKSSKTGLYNAVLAKLDSQFVVLPPSAAVAGVYAKTDNERGVWKAPANASLNRVIAPAVKIDDEIQGGMNVDPTSGKSINAIRSFMGKGNLIWGARTLAGNDNEWRYVPVRRLFNMVEESVKKSTYWAVFEPNDANTWTKVRGMIENYLVQKWREGALAGATPREAFFVRCGLGTTMDSQDILEGRMNVEIGMAAVRPAEFIILKFSHMLQTS